MKIIARFDTEKDVHEYEVRMSGREMAIALLRKAYQLREMKVFSGLVKVAGDAEWISEEEAVNLSVYTPDAVFGRE